MINSSSCAAAFTQMAAIEAFGSPESDAAVASIMAMAEDFIIEPGAVSSELPHSLPMHLDDVERTIIRQALARTQFNRTKAAELLGISFRQLRYRMQRLSIHEQE